MSSKHTAHDFCEEHISPKTITYQVLFCEEHVSCIVFVKDILICSSQQSCLAICSSQTQCFVFVFPREYVPRKTNALYLFAAKHFLVKQKHALTVVPHNKNYVLCICFEEIGSSQNSCVVRCLRKCVPHTSIRFILLWGNMLLANKSCFVFCLRSYAPHKTCFMCFGELCSSQHNLIPNLFGGLDMYFRCVDLYLGIWTCILYTVYL